MEIKLEHALMELVPVPPGPVDDGANMEYWADGTPCIPTVPQHLRPQLSPLARVLCFLMANRYTHTGWWIDGELVIVVVTFIFYWASTFCVQEAMNNWPRPPFNGPGGGAAGSSCAIGVI